VTDYGQVHGGYSAMARRALRAVEHGQRRDVTYCGIHRKRTRPSPAWAALVFTTNWAVAIALIMIAVPCALAVMAWRATAGKWATPQPAPGAKGES